MEIRTKLTFIFALLACGTRASTPSTETGKPCPNSDQLERCQCFAYDERSGSHRDLQCTNIKAADLYREFGKILSHETFFSIQIRNSDMSEIDGLPEEALSSSLETLKFDSANLDSAKIPKLIERMDNLKNLLVDNNQNKIELKRETFSEDVPIETLDLNGNRMVDGDIADDSFQNIRNTLTVLSMRENSLTKLPEAIRGLPNLQILDLANNPIDVASPNFMEILNTLPHIRRINVDKIDCKCSTIKNDPFISFIRGRLMSDVVCTEPQKFAGKKVTQITDKDCTAQAGLGGGDDEEPDGSGNLSLSFIALIASFLLLLSIQ